MPIEGNYGPWLTDTIASGTTTGEINLRNNFKRVIVMVPTITSGTITVHVAKASDGTYFPMYALDDDATGDFAHATSAATNTKAVIFEIGGAQYIKVVFGASQSTLTVTVRGIK